MRIDYHLHSQYSGDSKTTMEAICAAAIEKNIQEIAFTDHVDFSYPKMRPDHYIADFDHYLETLARYQQRYAGRLTIRAGVEIGLEKHRLAEYDTLLRQYPFDFVIGSVHEYNGFIVSKPEFYQGKTKAQAYEAYYSAILECIRLFDNFDVIGHLDYCKRYCPGEYGLEDYLIAQPIIEEIFRTLIAKGKGIEVNTSGFRHSSEMCMPHYDILSLYRQMGGTRLTIGSDSHRDEVVGFHLTDVITNLKQIGFTHISTFEQRKEIKQPL